MSWPAGVSCAQAGIAVAIAAIADVARMENFNIGHAPLVGPQSGRLNATPRPYGPVHVAHARDIPRSPGTPRPRKGSTVAGRSPGFRVVASAPPSRPCGQWHCWGDRSPVTVAGAAPASRPDFPFAPPCGEPVTARRLCRSAAKRKRRVGCLLVPTSRPPVNPPPPGGGGSRQADGGGGRRPTSVVLPPPPTRSARHLPLAGEDEKGRSA